ncbi:diguanylate cyclase [Neptunomonas sp. XY-337]|uniref:sensor domain-containing diguanylate cyclase n=1 Tax=Neptunomonas sp. XY-337 TaxID=2561897 RepID=UPI00145B9780|nr:diguanylate cyclase [Neptunomonas sp. XY-337]
MFLTGKHVDLAASLEAVGAPISIWERSYSGKLLFVSGNSRFQEIVDQRLSGLVEHDLASVLPRYVASQIEPAIDECLDSQRSVETEVVIERHGRTRWWRFQYSPLLTREGEVRRLMNTCIEITEKKELERSLDTSLRRFEAVINTAYDGIISVDESQQVKMFNQAAGDMFGIKPDSAVGRPLTDLMPARYRHGHHGYMEGFKHSPVMSRPMHTRESVTGLRSDGTEFPLEVTISKIQVGTQTEMTAVLRDISERSRLMEELREAASFDSSTGLYNRRFFEDQTERELARCRYFGHKMTLMVIAVDRYKELADGHGNSFGDRLMSDVAKAVVEGGRKVDIVARYYAGSLAILLPEMPAEKALERAEAIRKYAASALAPESMIPITFSIGVAEFCDESHAEELFARAERALSRAGENEVEQDRK